MSRPRSDHGRPRSGGTVLALLAAVLLVLAPASAGASVRADDDGSAERPDLTVAITGLTPATLDGSDTTVTLSGQVANPARTAVRDAVVHLVVRAQPYDDRAGLDDAIADPGTATTGERIAAEAGRARLGTVAAGATVPFTLSVPLAQLGLTGETGVYPIGAQVLTGEDVSRDADGDGGRPAGGAFTFLPLVGSVARPVDVSVVLPFLAPVRRTTAGRYTGSTTLLSYVEPGGRLRRQLDLAERTLANGGEAARGTTLLIDPALLDALADLGARRYGPRTESTPTPDTEATPTPTEDDPSAPDDGTDGTDGTDGDDGDGEGEGDDDATAGSADARAFLADLVALARDRRTWVVAYGRPDVQGLVDAGADGEGPGLAEVARGVADDGLARYGLSGRPVFWPSNGIVGEPGLAASLAAGDEGAVLSPRVLPGWRPSVGSSLVRDDARRRVLVRDPVLLRGGSDRRALSVRQRVLSEAAFAALGGARVRQVMPVLGPEWDPGAGGADADLAQVFAPAWTRAVAPDDVARPWSAGVRVPRRLTPTPVRAAQVSSARSTAAAARDLRAITGDGALARYYLEGAALAVAQLWRQDPVEGVRRATALDRSAQRRLGRVGVETIPVLTLSGTTGEVPISITNRLDRPVTVGVRVRSRTGRVDVPDVEPLELQPDQRQTVRVEIDVGEQTSAPMTAQLTTPDGRAFGAVTDFSVRSSLVGRTVWYVLGGAAALLVLALGRRFVLARRDRR